MAIGHREGAKDLTESVPPTSFHTDNAKPGSSSDFVRKVMVVNSLEYETISQKPTSVTTAIRKTREKTEANE